jgi:hypothetical protein
MIHRPLLTYCTAGSQDAGIETSIDRETVFNLLAAGIYYGNLFLGRITKYFVQFSVVDPE